MKYHDWSNFKVSCNNLYGLMSRPKNYGYLNKRENKLYSELLKKESLSDSDNVKLILLNEKIDRFNNPPLSVTTKSYLLSKYAWVKYNKGSIPFLGKKASIEKGLYLEQQAFDIIRKKHKIDYSEGTEFISNDYILGKADLYSHEHNKVIDTKISWGIQSYLPVHNSILPAKYWYQMQGYLELYNIEHGEVCFLLMNTPQHLIDRERKKFTDKYLLGEIDSEKYEDEMERCDLCYNYNKIPKSRKVITFSVERDKEAMELIYKKVILCREWLAEFDRKHCRNKNIITLSKDYLKSPYDEEQEDIT